jgi:predicted lipoprotein with Yx(FWY)xxD motif
LASWKVLAGRRRGKLAEVRTVARHGFETAVRLRSTRARFEVQALDAKGKVLGTSVVVRPTKSPSATAAAGTSIGTRKTKLGSVLATSSGHVLYLFAKDGSNRSACAGACARTWKPLVAGGKVSVVPGSGVDAKLLGTIKRSDGTTQVVYAHHPLYANVADRKAGDMHGEGANEFGGRWYAVNTKGGSVKPKKSGGVPVCNPLCGGY